MLIHKAEDMCRSGHSLWRDIRIRKLRHPSKMVATELSWMLAGCIRAVTYVAQCKVVRPVTKLALCCKVSIFSMTFLVHTSVDDALPTMLPATLQSPRKSEPFFFPIAVSCQSGCLHNEQCHSAILIDFRKFEFKYFIYFEFVLCGKVLFMAGPPCQPLSGLNMSYRGTKRRKKYFDEESIRTSLNFSHVSQK